MTRLPTLPPHRPEYGLTGSFYVMYSKASMSIDILFRVEQSLISLSLRGSWPRNWLTAVRLPVNRLTKADIRAELSGSLMVA